MKIANIIKHKLESSLAVKSLEIIDDSEKHIGHAGYKEGGQTHFTLKIIADEFKGLTKIKQHKLVYKILADELNDSIHALSLQTSDLYLP